MSALNRSSAPLSFLGAWACAPVNKHVPARKRNRKRTRFMLYLSNSRLLRKEKIVLGSVQRQKRSGRDSANQRIGFNCIDIPFPYRYDIGSTIFLSIKRTASWLLSKSHQNFR